MAPISREVSCPNCPLTFRDSSAVIQHLNHPYSSCARWFVSTTNLPSAPVPNYASTTAFNDPGGTSTKFPFAGHVFSRSDGFMDHFHADKFSDERSQNMFYPFSSKGEWQIASFLSRTGLSMRFIDEFLSLDLVSGPFVAPSRDVVDTFVRSSAWGYHSNRRKQCVVVLNSFQLVPSGYQRLSPSLATTRRIPSPSTTATQ